VKQAIIAYENRAWIRSWNLHVPVLSNVGTVSCSSKQHEPLMGLKLRLIMSQTHCPPCHQTKQEGCYFAWLHNNWNGSQVNFKENKVWKYKFTYMYV